MRLQTMQLRELTPDPANPRSHDSKNMDAIRTSLAQHGQVEPLVVQASSGMVIAGNGRLEAMKQLKWDTCSVVMLEVDDQEARALSIKLNRSGELAGWNEDVLSQHLAELSTFSNYDIHDFGFSEAELSELIDTLEALEPMGEQEKAKEVPEPEVSDEEGEPSESLLDEHVQPTDMRASKQREVRLYLSPEDEQTMQLMVRALAKHFELDNITDTVMKAVTLQFELLEKDLAED